MTLSWAGGAELQSVANTVEFSAIVTTAPAIETTTKRSGNAAWRISNAAAIEGFRQIHTAAQGQFFFQFYLRLVAMPTNTRVIGGARITGANKISFRLTAAGLLQFYNSEDSAQVGTDSSALSLNTWYRVAMMYDSTTLASTAVEARAYTDVAGAAAFWNPSGTVDLAATPTSFGCYTDGADATLDYIVDDCTINDTTASGGPFNWNTWPPENKLIILRPNGNGDNSAWTGSDGNSTDNYLLVDETPPDSTDYVQSNTSGQIDDYDLEATPAAIGASDTINAVMVGVYAAVSDATSADPDMGLRIKASSGGSVAETGNLDVNSVTYHAPQPLPGNDNYAAIGSESNYEQPGGTTAWTKAALDTMQIGVRELVTDTHFARVAAIWAYVSFTPSAGVTVSLSAASLASASQTLTAAPGAVSPALASALLGANPQAFAIVPGAVSSALAAALLSASPQIATVVPGAVTAALVEALLNATAQAVSIDAGGSPQTITLSAATLTAGPQTITPIPGEATVTLAAASLAASAQAILAVPGAATATLLAASLTAEAQQLSIIPGGASIALAAVTITATANPVSTSGLTTVTLNAALLTASAPVIGRVPGSVSALLVEAVLTANPQAVTIIAPFPPLVVALQSALLLASAQTETAIGGPVDVLLVAAVLGAAAQLLTAEASAIYHIAPSARRVRVDARERLTEPTGAGKRVVIVEREHR